MRTTRVNTDPNHAAIPPAWRAARRVLIVRLDNLGDVLLMTPAIRAVRESLPTAHLTLLTSPVGAQVGALNPDVDDVVVYDSPMVDPWQRLPHDSEREQRMIALLKEGCFDAAIIFTSFRQSPLPLAYLCYLADIPLRLAASVDGCGSLLTTRHKHPPKAMHEVERALDLVNAVGLRTGCDDLVLDVPDEAQQDIQRLRRKFALRSPLIVVHPGCSMPARTYPWELYAVVVDQLIQRLNATVVLTGTEAENDVVERIRACVRPARAARAVSLAGELGVEQLCALIDTADLTVTNNTGPMHISAAVQTPVVALFALTNSPEEWYPWRVRHRLLYRDVECRLCYSRVCPHQHACLRSVAPQDVVAAAGELLAEIPIRMRDKA